MKRKLFLILTLLMSAPVFSCLAQSRVIEFDSPKMKVFLPPAGLGNGKAVVACPGGGYSHLARNHEGYFWAPFFNNLGIALAVVEYEMPNGDRTIPMSDVEETFKILTDSAEVWKINPDSIGVMGSSAGGHLASTMSTHPTAICKPAFQILFYPVISLDESITHAGTRRGFLGENPSQELVEQWSSDKQVTAETPRAFMVLCSDDKVVVPMNSINYYNALVENNVPAAMFIYPKGGHGWGSRDKFVNHDQMIAELTAWLKSF